MIYLKNVKAFMDLNLTGFTWFPCEGKVYKYFRSENNIIRFSGILPFERSLNEKNCEIITEIYESKINELIFLKDTCSKIHISQFGICLNKSEADSSQVITWEAYEAKILAKIALSQSIILNLQKVNSDQIISNHQELKEALRKKKRLERKLEVTQFFQKIFSADGSNFLPLAAEKQRKKIQELRKNLKEIFKSKKSTPEEKLITLINFKLAIENQKSRSEVIEEARKTASHYWTDSVANADKLKSSDLLAALKLLEEHLEKNDYHEINRNYQTLAELYLLKEDKLATIFKVLANPLNGEMADLKAALISTIGENKQSFELLFENSDNPEKSLDELIANSEKLVDLTIAFKRVDKQMLLYSYLLLLAVCSQNEIQIRVHLEIFSDHILNNQSKLLIPKNLQQILSKLLILKPNLFKLTQEYIKNWEKTYEKPRERFLKANFHRFFYFCSNVNHTKDTDDLLRKLGKSLPKQFFILFNKLDHSITYHFLQKNEGFLLKYPQHFSAEKISQYLDYRYRNTVKGGFNEISLEKFKWSFVREHGIEFAACLFKNGEDLSHFLSQGYSWINESNPKDFDFLFSLVKKILTPTLLRKLPENIATLMIRPMQKFVLEVFPKDTKEYQREIIKKSALFNPSPGVKFLESCLTPEQVFESLSNLSKETAKEYLSSNANNLSDDYLQKKGEVILTYLHRLKGQDRRKKDSIDLISEYLQFCQVHRPLLHAKILKDLVEQIYSDTFQFNAEIVLEILNDIGSTAFTLTSYEQGLEVFNGFFKDNRYLDQFVTFAKFLEQSNKLEDRDLLYRLATATLRKELPKEVQIFLMPIIYQALSNTYLATSKEYEVQIIETANLFSEELGLKFLNHLKFKQVIKNFSLLSGELAVTLMRENHFEFTKKILEVNETEFLALAHLLNMREDQKKSIYLEELGKIYIKRERHFPSSLSDDLILGMANFLHEEIKNATEKELKSILSYLKYFPQERQILKFIEKAFPSEKLRNHFSFLPLKAASVYIKAHPNIFTNETQSRWVSYFNNLTPEDLLLEGETFPLDLIERMLPFFEKSTRRFYDNLLKENAKKELAQLPPAIFKKLDFLEEEITNLTKQFFGQKTKPAKWNENLKKLISRENSPNYISESTIHYLYRTANLSFTFPKEITTAYVLARSTQKQLNLLKIAKGLKKH